MIKFFRHIRQNLLMENLPAGQAGKTDKPALPPASPSGRSGRYFKYAIGEIVLVVIGILIALQINNWNNNRINSNRETSYIKNIERDLNNQLKAIDIQTNYEATIADQCIIALKPYNENNKLKIDSTFAIAIGTIASRRTFTNTNPVYTELISSGNIELLKNETFKNELINYYQELERVEKIISGNNSLYTDQEFIPAMLQLGVLDTREDLKNIFRGYNNQYKINNVLTASNVTHLLAISEKQLENEENELLFINHLSARYDYAMIHIYFLIEFRNRTTRLLESIKNY